MNITYFDSKGVEQKAVDGQMKKLTSYRNEVQAVIEKSDTSRPEVSLATWKDPDLLKGVYETAAQFRKVKHVVLIGIGGSTLGAEAIHSVLAHAKSPQLHILDTVSAVEVERVLEALRGVKKLDQIAICVVSKSGGTTETLANAAVVLESLQVQLGQGIYQQTIFIGDAGNELLKKGKKLGGKVLTMPQIVGGRYSVFTSVGLLPLALLGHDLEALLSGVQDATAEPFESSAAEGAARLYSYLKKGHNSVNFFAFDTRLVRLGKWYRQLTAESLGKEFTKSKASNKLGFVPTISTPVELHSIGQLYFSGFKGVYTDFVSFDDEVSDFVIDKKTKIAPNLKGKTLQEIQTAIYGGVIGAYQTRELPYRTTLFDNELTYSLGLFMAMRMLETMYVAHLMEVNAFDQPNVELYKDKTRDILGV